MVVRFEGDSLRLLMLDMTPLTRYRSPSRILGINSNMKNIWKIYFDVAIYFYTVVQKKRANFGGL